MEKSGIITRLEKTRFPSTHLIYPFGEGTYKPNSVLELHDPEQDQFKPLVFRFCKPQAATRSVSGSIASFSSNC